MHNPCREVDLTRPRVYYKHIKRGSIYLYIDKLELDWDYIEGDTFLYHTPLSLVDVEIQRATNIRGPVIIYMSLENYKLYARPKSEFFDGRFEEIKY